MRPCWEPNFKPTIFPFYHIMPKQMAIKEHEENTKAFAGDGRWGKMLATKLGMDVPCDFLPAHSLVLLMWS